MLIFLFLLFLLSLNTNIHFFFFRFSQAPKQQNYTALIVRLHGSTFFSSSDLQLSSVLVSHKGTIFFLIIFSSIFGFLGFFPLFLFLIFRFLGLGWIFYSNFGLFFCYWGLGVFFFVIGFLSLFRYSVFGFFFFHYFCS